jgi:endonuclease III
MSTMDALFHDIMALTRRGMNKTRESIGVSGRQCPEEIAGKLLQTLGGKFSTSLGIDLAKNNPEETFKWFLASILFGARIGQTIAANTYQEFAKRGVLSPKRILATGWDGLVEILDAGGYVRYDFKTATKLLEIMRALDEGYEGDIRSLHRHAEGPRDLEARLQEFKGIGPTTANIFLRELRGIWDKADPLPSEWAMVAARRLGLTASSGRDEREKAQALSDLKQVSSKVSIPLSDLEAALVRLGKDYCRKGRCTRCPLKEDCQGATA